MSTFDFATDTTGEDLARSALASMEGGGIEVTGDSLRVTMGEPPIFTAIIPRTAIRSAQPIPDSETPSRGVHGSFGKWLVNRAGVGLVKLTISPPARANLSPPQLTKKPGRILSFLMRTRTIKLRELTLSTSHPDDLIRELGF